MSQFVAPFDIGDTGVRTYVDLPTLEAELMATPEAIYLFMNYCGKKHGVQTEGKGSTTQLTRSIPFPEPDPDNLDDALVGGEQFPLDIADPDNAITPDFSAVRIRVQRRMMKPFADYTEESRQLSQIALQGVVSTNITRHYRAYVDDMVREEYRSHVATEIYGGSLVANAGLMNATLDGDGFPVHGLNWAMLKEYKNRAALLRLRAFGSEPGTDGQALAGSYIAITDQHGINELDEDPFWREFAIRDGGSRDKLIKGYIGELEQVLVLKSDRMRTTGVGPSGAITAHEVLLLAGDPFQIEDPPEGMVQGFKTDFPVCFAEVGGPEVKANKNDSWGERYKLAWFNTMCAQALEEMDKNPDGTLVGGAPTTTAMATLLGVPVAVGASRFIHRGLFF